MLSLHLERVDGYVIIECRGRIVRSESAFTLRNAVMSQADARTIVLDLSEVQAVEAGGLGMLSFLVRWAHEHDVRLKVFNPVQAVYQKLVRAHLTSECELATPSEMQALWSRRRSTGMPKAA